MFRQKQTPRGNNPPPSAKKKKCSANAKQKPQENTHIRMWSPQSCICNSIEITPPRRLSPANQLRTHKTLSQKNISGGLLLYWYLFSKLDFVKRNLLKVMRPLISCDYLITVIVENVCRHNLTKFPCKRTKN